MLKNWLVSVPASVAPASVPNTIPGVIFFYNGPIDRAMCMMRTKTASRSENNGCHCGAQCEVQDTVGRKILRSENKCQYWDGDYSAANS